MAAERGYLHTGHESADQRGEPPLITTSWYSERLRREIGVARWGEVGAPLLLFPPAGGDAREVERCQLIAALEEPLRERRIKVYTPDGIPARGWTDPSMPPHERATLQLRYADYVYNELVPFIRGDCFDPGLEIVAAGAAFGAFNALMALCRHPDAFRAAICLSGIYDLEHFMGGAHTLDFHFASPLHFLPYLDEGEHLETLRGRIAVLAMGGGRFEEPQDSWRMADVLGSRGVPNRVDDWGPGFDHDWSTWRVMLPRYVQELL